MKPQFETYRYVGEICPIKSQSIVECRLPGSEIGSILAIHAQAVPAECTCLDGEVQYGGKLLLSLLYEDLDKKVCRVERGAEFFHKAEDAQVTPSHFCSAELFAENVTWRREGSGLYVSVVVDARLTVHGVKQMEYLIGGEGMIVKKEPIALYKTVAVRGEVEGEDEFDTDCVGDILLHSENVVISRMQASNGQIDIEGEMSLHICVLRNDETLCAMERILPIKMTLPSEEAFGNVVAGGKVKVTSAHLSLQLDEEKETGRVVLSYVLSASCFLTVKEEISVLADGFSLTSEITLKKQNEGGMYLMRQEKGMERIQGSALLSPEIDGEYFLQVAVLPRAEIAFKKGEKGWEAEGVILAEVLFKNEEGNYRASTLTLPFLFPVDGDGEKMEADCMVSGLNIRRKKTGETEAECVLKLTIRKYADREWSYVSELEEGEAYPKQDSAFSIFMTKAGEDLWALSKRLVCDPEELCKSNPELTFPLKKEERIFVYRQLADS